MNERDDDMYQAASRYYIQGETMDSIAKQLGLSRSTVSRLLKEARRTGLVRISLADFSGSHSPLATKLVRAFGVRVHLVPVRESAAPISISSDSVRARAKEILAPYKVTREIIFVEALPRNALGKVVKPELVRLIAEGKIGLPAAAG